MCCMDTGTISSEKHLTVGTGVGWLYRILDNDIKV